MKSGKFIMIDIIINKQPSKNYIYYTFKPKNSLSYKDLRIIFYKNYCNLSIQKYVKLTDFSTNEDLIKINLGDCFKRSI